MLLDGILCRTVLAAAQRHPVHRPDPWCHVLLDQRPIMRGWITLPVEGGLLSVDATHGCLPQDLPLGFSADVPEIPVGEVLYAITPGGVPDSSPEPPDPASAPAPSAQADSDLDTQVDAASDVLRLAGLPHDARVHVYHNDTPWPMLDGTILHTSTADLLLILLEDHGWNPGAPLPGDFSDTTWILADERFILRPAVPYHMDHTHAGSLSKAILVAHIAPEGRTYQEPRVPIVILDQRPMMLGFSWLWAHHGQVEVDALLASARTRPIRNPIPVSDGDVLTIEIHLIQATAVPVTPLIQKMMLRATQVIVLVREYHSGVANCLFGGAAASSLGALHHRAALRLDPACKITRPIPTPCRAIGARKMIASSGNVDEPACSLGRDGLASEVQLDDLHTLLEDSVKARPLDAFFEVRAVAEALYQHFAEVPLTLAPSTSVFPAHGIPSSEKRLLLLDHLVTPVLPPDAHTRPGTPMTRPLCIPLEPRIAWDQDLTIGGTKLGFTLDDLAGLLNAATAQLSWGDVVMHVPTFDGSNLRDFHAALPGLCAATPCGDLVIYTDGSYTPATTHRLAKAGWAVIVLDPHAVAVSFVFGPVTDWLVEAVHELSPYIAECYALMVAAAVAAHSFSDSCCHFLSDCTAAIDAAAGRCSHQLHGIPAAMSAAHTFRRQPCPGAEIHQHIPGHAGILGNELADEPSSNTGLAFQRARAALLAGQLLSHDVHVAFLQETRADAGQSMAGKYIRLASGGVKGQFGTELWLKQGHEILRTADGLSQATFQKESLCVLEADYFLHTLVRTFDLCLPATFPECHRGIQAAHATPDHVAATVLAEVHFTQDRLPARLKRRNICAATKTAPENGPAISEAFRTAPQVDWDVSVHAHAALLADHMQQALQAIGQSSNPTGRITRTCRTLLGCSSDNVSRTRHDLYRLTHQICRNDMAIIFVAWAKGVPLGQVAAAGLPWQRRAEAACTRLRRQLQSGCKALKKACRADRDEYVTRLAHTLSTAPTKEAYAAYHRLLAHRRKKTFSCLGFTTTRARFARTLNRRESVGGNIFLAWKPAGPPLLRTLPGMLPLRSWIEITEVPSVTDLRRVLAATKINKAAGLDSIPPELNKFFAQESAQMLHPLLVKTLWAGVEPAGFKGGRAVILYKGRGSTTACTSYRSILLMNTWAKAFHQSVRPNIRQLFEQSAPSLQIGGKVGCSTAYGTHVLRAVTRRAVSCGVSSYILFADISAALYSTLLQFVASVSHNSGPHMIARALDSLALPADVAEDIEAMLSLRTVLRFPPHVAPGQVVRGRTSCSRCLCPASSDTAICSFNLLQQLDSQPRSPELPWDGCRTLAPCSADSGTIRVQEVTWADDIATPHQCADASEVEACLRADATALTEAYAFGFRLSFGAAAAAERPSVGFSAPLGSMIEKLKYRAAQAKSAYGEARRKIYKPRGIPLRKKAVFLATTVLPKLMQSAGSWPPFNKREEKLFNGTVWTLYRSVLGVPSQENQRITAATCFAILQLPDPRTLLRLSRLSYLGQMFRSGPAELRAAVRSDPPYATMVHGDLVWLFSWCWKTVDLPSPDVDWDAWSRFITTQPGR
ncbi:unnamed protein product [Symbiodinium sp. CCMP2592]|nr:unnamed protein product [Symbiodinium sp. CCMP2592]